MHKAQGRINTADLNPKTFRFTESVRLNLISNDTTETSAIENYT